MGNRLPPPKTTADPDQEAELGAGLGWAQRGGEPGLGLPAQQQTALALCTGEPAVLLTLYRLGNTARVWTEMAK